jgi:ankyrin repeat protein
VRDRAGTCGVFGLLGAAAHLLRRGHSPLAPDCHGVTPVSHAAGHGHVAVSRLLLEHCSPHESGGWSAATFRMAAANGHDEH